MPSSKVLTYTTSYIENTNECAMAKNSSSHKSANKSFSREPMLKEARINCSVTDKNFHKCRTRVGKKYHSGPAGGGMSNPMKPLTH
jgi:hypothetical protein